MDKLVYISAVAAKSALQRHENVSNNLANVSTPGFKSQLMAFQSAPLKSSEGLASRAFSMETTVGFDDAEGSLQQTGRSLDLAIQGKGWFTLQTANGEGYTRSGHFQTNADGVLVNSSGLSVVEEGGGEIVIPAGFRFDVSDEGVISGVDPGQNEIVRLGRVKLVNPAKDDIERSDDGLFRLKSGQDADSDQAVRLASGYLESSNVNAAGAMVDMISTQREFEANLKMISLAEENSKRGDSLLGLN